MQFSSKPGRLSVLAIAVHLATGALVSSPLFFSTAANAQSGVSQRIAQQVDQQEQVNFSIAADSLTKVLNQYAEQAGLYLTASAELTKAKTSAGLTGSYTRAQALAKILQDTGISFNFKGKTVTLSRDTGKVMTLATAIVASEDLKNGSAADGYLVEKITAVGPWQGRTLQETPYSISVVSESLIENLQATTADQVYKINPVMQLTFPAHQNDNSSATMRGFESSSVAQNGINRQKWDYSHNVVMEETARIEILTGLSGFIYGGDNLGGTINYVSKRPTNERLNNITIGNTSGRNLYLHGDFGGQFDADGTFGYRINVVTQDGDTHIKHKNIKRNSISALLDWQLSDDLLLEINASKRDYRLEGKQAYLYLADGVERPIAKAIDNNQLWSQAWAMTENNSLRLGASIDWKLSDTVTLRGAYQTDETERQTISPDNTILNDMTYNQSANSNENAPQKLLGSGGYLFIDFDFSTGNIQHKLTTGWQGSKSHRELYENSWSESINYLGLTFTTPTYKKKPDWSNHDGGAVTDKYKLSSNNFTIGDDIQLNKQWSALLGFGLVQINVTDYWRGDYKESALTPNISIVYKPLDNITSYLSYNESLEIGGIAEESYESSTNEENVVNAGEVLDPLTSSQLELGAKINIGDMFVTASLFEIDKALEYYRAVNDSQKNGVRSFILHKKNGVRSFILHYLSFYFQLQSDLLLNNVF